MLKAFLVSAVVWSLGAGPVLAGACDKLFLDLDKGTLNGVKLTASLAEVQKAFPCPHTRSKDQFGEHLFFTEQGFYLTVGKSILVSGVDEPGFMGDLSKDLLGKGVLEVGDLLGDVAYTAHQSISGSEQGARYRFAFYPRPWGTLIVKYSYFSPAYVEEVMITTQKLAELKKLYP